eukprot:jgi/Botrbrau1/9208/Bobra.0028s0005.1
METSTNQMLSIYMYCAFHMLLSVLNRLSLLMCWFNSEGTQVPIPQLNQRDGQFVDLFLPWLPSLNALSVGEYGYQLVIMLRWKCSRTVSNTAKMCFDQGSIWSWLPERKGPR